MDLTFQMERPSTPIGSSSSIDRVNYEKWERSNCMSLMIIKQGIPKAFRGVISKEITNAKEFLIEIER